MEPKLPTVDMYGKTLKSHWVAGLRIAETTYNPGLKVPQHSHENGYFSLVLEGTFDGVYGRKAQKGRPFCVVFRPPDEPHSVRFHRTGARLFSIEVETSYLERVREHSLRLDQSTELAGGELAWLALRIYREVCDMDKASPLAIEGLFLEMLAAASRRSMKVEAGRVPGWLRRVKEILNASSSERLTIAGIAEMVDVHPVYLATAFRRHYHCTIGDYTRQLRVEHACHLLSRSHTPLVEVALAVGFSDQSHFSKTFKQLTGFSPGRFRADFLD